MLLNCGNMDSSASIPGTVITLEFDGKENKSKESEAMENGFSTVIDMRGVNGKLITLIYFCASWYIFFYI